jgi:hypothetical protein
MKFANATKFHRKFGAAEGCAVQRTFHGNVFRRSVAQWWDLLFLLAHANAQALHLAVQMAAFQAQRFRRPAYISMAFIDLL